MPLFFCREGNQMVQNVVIWTIFIIGVFTVLGNAKLAAFVILIAIGTKLYLKHTGKDNKDEQ